MVPLKEKELKSHQDKKQRHICSKKFRQKLVKDREVRDHCHFSSKYRDEAHSSCNLKFNFPNKIPVVFHNRLNYDYHLIMKELANDFKGKFGKTSGRKYKRVQNFYSCNRKNNGRIMRI